MKADTKKHFIIFDGECWFCDGVVRFLAVNDTNDKFLFVSNQSKNGRELLSQSQVDAQLVQKTIVLITEDKTYIKSKAFTEILKQIPKYSFIPSILKFLPEFIVDFFYAMISRYRRKIILKKTCTIPDFKIRQKFIVD